MSNTKPTCASLQAQVNALIAQVNTEVALRADLCAKIEALTAMLTAVAPPAMKAKREPLPAMSYASYEDAMAMAKDIATHQRRAVKLVHNDDATYSLV